MSEFPELDDDSVIELSREGGIAFMPGLQRQHRFTLRDLPAPQRESLCRLVRYMAGLAHAADGSVDAVGRGDERYYHIQVFHLDEKGDRHFAQLEWRVPESSAPPELEKLLKNGLVE